MYELKDNNLIIHLPKEVDDHSSALIGMETDMFLSEHRVDTMIFDFSSTNFMDSSGIGVILGRLRRMRQLGGNIAVTGESPRIHRILRIAGIYKIIL